MYRGVACTPGRSVGVRAASLFVCNSLMRIYTALYTYLYVGLARKQDMVCKGNPRAGGRFAAFADQPDRLALFLASVSFLVFYVHVQCKPFLTWVENEVR